MESIHFKNLYNSLTITLISVIKEKIGRSIIDINYKDKLLLHDSPVHTDIKNPIKVKHLSSEYLTFSDETSLEWEKIQKFEDLLKCLEFIEYHEKKRSDEFISIQWGVIDFERRASELEEVLSDTELKFDRSQFPYALKVLEDRHDCNLGITWNDVDEILYEFCKLS